MTEPVRQPALLDFQPRFLHAAAYAVLTLHVSRELFPGEPFFKLSATQRQVVEEETVKYLTQCRWRVESLYLAQQFSTDAGAQTPAPPGTVLGEPVLARKSQEPDAAKGGNYL